MANHKTEPIYQILTGLCLTPGLTAFELEFFDPSFDRFMTLAAFELEFFDPTFDRFMTLTAFELEFFDPTFDRFMTLTAFELRSIQVLITR